MNQNPTIKKMPYAKFADDKTPFAERRFCKIRSDHPSARWKHEALTLLKKCLTIFNIKEITQTDRTTLTSSKNIKYALYKKKNRSGKTSFILQKQRRRFLWALFLWIIYNVRETETWNLFLLPKKANIRKGVVLVNVVLKDQYEKD